MRSQPAGSIETMTRTLALALAVGDDRNWCVRADGRRLPGTARQRTAKGRRRAGRRGVEAAPLPMPANGCRTTRCAATRCRPTAHRSPHRLRRPQHLLRLPLLRQRAGQDPHHRQPARQRLQRRLDRHEPRFGRHRPDGLSPVLEPERHPDGCAQHLGVGRAVRRRRGLVQRRQDHRPTATSSRSRCRCRRCGSRAATRCGWAWCSSARSAASACRMRGRRCCPASGCSIGPRTCCSRI